MGRLEKWKEGELLVHGSIGGKRTERYGKRVGADGRTEARAAAYLTGVVTAGERTEGSSIGAGRRNQVLYVNAFTSGIRTRNIIQIGFHLEPLACVHSGNCSFRSSDRPSTVCPWSVSVSGLPRKEGREVERESELAGGFSVRSMYVRVRTQLTCSRPPFCC